MERNYLELCAGGLELCARGAPAGDLFTMLLRK